MTDSQAEMIGHVDGIFDGHVCGWAWDPSDPKRKVEVQILDRGRVIARAVADLFRQDLAESKIGDGKYHFRIPVPASLITDQQRYLSVIARVSGGEELPGSPITHVGDLALEANQKHHLSIDDLLRENVEKVRNTQGADARNLIFHTASCLRDVERQYGISASLSFAYVFLLRRNIDPEAFKSRKQAIQQRITTYEEVIQGILQSDEFLSLGYQHIVWPDDKEFPLEIWAQS